MFDDQEFLDVARHLQFADSREGFQRSAISRAYYSAFLLARAFCREQGLIPQTGSGADHRAVPNALMRYDDKLALELRKLHQLRTDADYSVRTQNAGALARDVQLAIDLADFIRSELMRLR